MELVELKLHAYRRLKGAVANLHGTLIALVGPNEAGKSSLLDALVHLNNTDPFDAAEISRDEAVGDDQRVLSARFLLRDEDRAAVSHLPGGAKARWFIVNKYRNGTLRASVEPALSLDMGPRQAARSSVARLLGTRWGSALTYEDGDLGQRLQLLDPRLESTDVLTTETRTEISEIAGQLAAIEGSPKSAKSLGDRLVRLVESEPETTPLIEAVRVLLPRRPQFLKFTQPHRDLASTYELSGMDLDSPPIALQNLSRLAGLDLRKLLDDVQQGDYASPERPIEEANRQLARFFRESWTQSGVAVRLSNHETRLHVLIAAPTGPYTSIQERSDGLREFVALATFAEVYGSEDRDLVLLIDEAETHLHYNAQADLVRVLDLQRAAVSVIYTTHSAGCLPEDLGSSVRVVVRTDDQWSEIQNSFWTKGVGFDPLLLGMGASALVFGAVRRAVIAEGATDLILMPALLREANGLKSLGYQVAPGVAEASSRAIEGLELQASRVAYVVDDDSGGRDHAKKLRRGGIDESRIFVLGAGLTRGIAIEDLVRRPLYLEAVNEELSRSGRAERLSLKDIPDRGRSAAVKRWCETRGYSEPRKVNVASSLALGARANAPLLTAEGRQVLQALHGRAIAYLEGRPAKSPKGARTTETRRVRRTSRRP